MENRYNTVDYVAFSLVGSAVLVAVLYVLFGWEKLGAFLVHPATAAWVQAWGSIGAIVAAIFVSRSDVRRRQKEDLVVAELTAAKVTRMLGFLGTAVQSANAWFTSMRDTGGPEARFQDFQRIFAEASIPSEADLRALAAIPGHASHHLVDALQLLEAVNMQLNLAVPITSKWSADQRKAAAGRLVRTLTPALNSIQQCESALDKFLEGRDTRIGSAMPKP